MTYCYIIHFVDIPEQPEEIPQPRPDPLQGAAVHLRTPSPSSSRAKSPRLWLTVACPRPQRASGLYPFHSSVYTIAPGPVAGRTVASINSSAPLPRPTRTHADRWYGQPPPVPQAGRYPRCRDPWPGSPAALEGRAGRCAAPLFSPAFWYISSASVRSSGSGERSAAARARAWISCRSRSRCRRLRPSSRASFAVGVPWANTAEDRRIVAGLRCVPCQVVPVNTLNPGGSLCSGSRRPGNRGDGGGRGGRRRRRIGGRPAPGDGAVQELLVAGVSVHQVDDREIHGVASLGKSAARPDRQETRKAGGVKGPTTKVAT